MNARTGRKRSRSSRSQNSIRNLLLGAGIGAVAAFLGLRFGQDLGYIVLPIAGAMGAVLARSLSAATGSRSTSSDQHDSQAVRSVENDEPVLGDEGATGSARGGVAPDPPNRVSMFAQPGPGEPDWPIETHEVRLKLDLAKEYLGADHPDLATHLLQEVFELEIATARKLAVEILRETEDTPPETLNAET